MIFSIGSHCRPAPEIRGGVDLAGLGTAGRHVPGIPLRPGALLASAPDYPGGAPRPSPGYPGLPGFAAHALYRWLAIAPTSQNPAGTEGNPVGFRAVLGDGYATTMRLDQRILAPVGQRCVHCSITVNHRGQQPVTHLQCEQAISGNAPSVTRHVTLRHAMSRRLCINHYRNW